MADWCIYQSYVNPFMLIIGDCWLDISEVTAVDNVVSNDQLLVVAGQRSRNPINKRCNKLPLMAKYCNGI